MRPSTYPAHLNMHKKERERGTDFFLVREAVGGIMRVHAPVPLAAARVWSISDPLIEFMTDEGRRGGEGRRERREDGRGKEWEKDGEGEEIRGGERVGKIRGTERGEEGEGRRTRRERKRRKRGDWGRRMREEGMGREEGKKRWFRRGKTGGGRRLGKENV